MSLRDADSLHLESAKIPELRRRGRSEPMAMPELEPQLVEDFVHRVTSETDREMLGAGSVAVTFADPDGGAYTVSIHRAATGYQLVARRAALGRPAGKAASASGAEAPGPEVSKAASPTAARAVAPAQHEPHHEVPDDAQGEAPWRAARRGPPPQLTAGPALAQAVLEAARRGASDLFLSTHAAPRLRVNGALEALAGVTVADDELAALFAAAAGAPAAVLARSASPSGQGSVDFALQVEAVRVRCNAFSHTGGLGLAVRLLAEEPPPLADLGLPPGVADALTHREGLVLVCGPTGSGKSTTLAALVQRLDSLRAAHVITLEDPVEYRLRARRGLIHQRELGADFSTFAGGLRAALRESPDVILLGELRDAESVAAALTAAETGHLVLATMHAPGAAGAVERILDIFDERRQRQVRTQLAGALRLVVTQLLLPRQGGGRVAAAEVVPVTPAVANIIRKGELQTLATAIQSGRDVGMVPLERSLAQLVQRGLVSEAEARRAATDGLLLRAQLS